MKHLVSIALLLGFSLTQDYPEVSRLGKDIKLLIQVTAPGASSPEVLFNKTKDPKEEPKIANYLSPLGQRQQFLVGTEYRLRYVDEQSNQFLNYSYAIDQIWIQSTFDQRTILSAQAQLIGMYPPQTYNMFLNEWQQGNAVPPLNNTNNQTWAHWQAELGSKAVLDGFNVYPINMVGADQDFLLNLGPKNCPLFNESLKTQDGLDFDKYADFLVRLSSLFDEKMFDLPAGYAACQYLLWADLHSIDLTVDYTEDDLKHCNQIMNDAASIYVSTDAKLKNIASNEFINSVIDYVKTHSGQQTVKESKHFLRFVEMIRKNERRELTEDELNASNDKIDPRYVFYATSHINLQMFVATLVGRDNWKRFPNLQQHIVPSSSLIMELTEVNGKYEIEAFLNDQKLPLVACQDKNPCYADAFVQYLKQNVQYADSSAVEKASISQDKQQSFNIHQPTQNQVGPNQNKPNLFGAPPNLGNNPPGPQNQLPQQAEISGKSKRDILWEQKRKQKHDIVNPPIVKEGQGQGGSSFLDQMAPIAPKVSNDFQRATTFEQPQALIEIQQPSSQPQPIQQQQQQVQMNYGQANAPQPSQPLDIAPSYQPSQMQQPQNMWDQMQNDQQMNYQQSFELHNNPPQQQFIMPELDSQQQLRNAPDLQFDYQPPQQFQQQSTPPPQQIQQPQPQPQHQQQQVVQNKKITQMNNQVSEDQKRKQQQYLQNLQQEIKEKEEKKRREKEDRIRKEQEELKKNMEYNPFGRAGAGAPIKDTKGNVVVSRKQGVEQNSQQQQQYIQQQPQVQQNQQSVQMYQQQQTPQQNQYNMYQQNQPMQQQYNPPQQQQMNQGMIQPQPMFEMNQQQNFQQPQFQQQQQMPMNLPIMQQQQFDPPPIEPSMFSPPQHQNTKQTMVEQQNSFQSQQEVGQSYQRGSAMNLGAFNEGEQSRQKVQKQELQNALKVQMEEQKRRKEEEIRKKKEEELREEQRIMKERQQLEEEFKREEEKKKAKFNEFQQANAQIIQSKNKQKREPIDLGDGPNFIVEKKGNPPPVQASPQINQSFDQSQRRPQLEMPAQPTGNPQISQTRIINDISNELKNNFKEEITRLRNEMSSQQRVFREQLERLKIETSSANQQKQEAMTEVEKIKNEIKVQREQQRKEEQKVFNALEKYNPQKPVDPLDMLNNYDKPGAVYANKQQPIINSYQKMDNPTPTYQRPGGGSRQESRDSQRKREINNYEKMFFGQGPVKSLQEMGKKEGQSYGIKEEKMLNLNEYNPYQQHQPKVMKRSESAYNNNSSFKMSGTLKGESTLLPVNSDPNEELRNIGYNPHKYDAPQYQYDSAPQYASRQDINKENKQSMNNNKPFDYIQQIAPNTHRMDTSSENTMDFVNRIVNQKEESNHKPSHNEDRMADKLDSFDFNFPSLPAYEGIQNDISYLNKENSNKQNNQQFSKPSKPIHTDPYINYTTPGEMTTNSIGTINSVNLEKVNRRNEDRLAKFGINLDDSPEPMGKKPYQQQQNNFPNSKNDTNEELKQLDNLLFDILRDNNSPQKENKYGNKISHLNSQNNAENMARMRDTRDQFLAPKLGSINEDKQEDYEGTFKAYASGGYKLDGNAQRYDSLLDGTNLALD